VDTEISVANWVAIACVGMMSAWVGWRVGRKHTDAELPLAESPQHGLADQLVHGLFSRAPAALIVCDTDGNVALVNDAAQSLFGFERNAMLGKPVAELFAANLRWVWLERQAQLVDAARAGVPEPTSDTRYELTVLTNTGERPVEVGLGTVLWGDQIWIVCSIRDIAESARVEESLLQAHRDKEDASRVKSEFLAMMTHELITPVAGIVGGLKLGLKASAIPDARQRMGTALENAQSLQVLLEDLLDLSRLESGKFSLEIQDFDLRRELEAALLVYRLQCTAKGLEFHIQIDTRLPPYLRGDPIRLRQVLLQLIGNAIKFTEQGSVTFNVQMLEGYLDLCHLQFEVVDTGLGISSGAQARLFKKFEQEDMSSSRRFDGAGMGLAIARQLIELMGGQIGVRSVVGRGSIFYFDALLELGQAPIRAATEAYAPHEWQLRVLCAEDVVTNQMVIESFLTAMGHQVDFADNGHLALEALASKQYDVVLMDLRMPVMDGLQATRHLRQGSHQDMVFLNPSIQVVALTANVSDEDRRRCTEAGMDDFLGKPVDEAAVHQALSRVIDLSLQAGKTLHPRPSQSEESTATTPDFNDLAGLDALLNLDATSAEASSNSTAAPAAAPGFSAAPKPVAADPTTKRADDLQSRMIAVFRVQIPARLAEIDAAMAAGDTNTAAIGLHGIKGSAAYIWPGSIIVELAKELEDMADQRNLAQFPEVLALLKGEIDIGLRDPSTYAAEVIADFGKW